MAEGSLDRRREAFEPPALLMPAPGPPGRHAPSAWLDAERRAARELAEAATAVARLDERLRHPAADRRAALRERLALVEAADLLWTEGVRLRPERLALADRGRVGRSAEAQAIARAAWAVRRLAADSPAPDSPAALRAFLGLHRAASDEAAAAEPALDRDQLRLSGLDGEAAAAWCAGLAALADAHPLTRAAAAFHLWRGMALSPPDRLLEAAVAAARLGAGMAAGGLSALPIALGNPRAVPPSRGDAAERLAAWLAAVAGAAGRARLMLDRLEDWLARAREATADMHGKGTPALLLVLAARPVLSARDAAGTLNISAAQARSLLARLERKGLVRELTGHARFRFWTAAL